MLFIVGVAFFTLSQAERTASLRHLDSLRARYIAEAGVAYAQKILKSERQSNLIDSLEDETFKHFTGSDLDLDGDGKLESRWFNVTDNQGNPFGRFAVKISDEASKVNLNVCKREILQPLFSQLGISEAKIDTLLNSRPLHAIEQAGAFLDKKEFARSKDFITVYSRDFEIDLEKIRRTYLNSPCLQLILETLLYAGIGNPYQKAVNLKDAADRDISQSVLYKFSLNNISPSSLLEAGSWRKVGNFYEAPAGGTAGKFAWLNLSVEDGDYFCFLYGSTENDVIAEVSWGAEGKPEYILSQEGLANKIKVEGGSLTLDIKPAKDKACRFSHIELVGLEPKTGLSRETVTGTEAVVINELMVKPSQEITISAVEINPGQSSYHVFSGIKPADYYVAVSARTKAGLVGDVTIEGRTKEKLYDGDYFPYTVNVDADGKIAVEIKNNSLFPATFGGIRILQEPDAEFIELLNLSQEEIDLSNFLIDVYSLQGQPSPGWPARIPQETKIGPYEHLLLAIDNRDASPSPQQLRNNRISFQSIWGVDAKGLIFDDYAASIDKKFDLLPNAGAKIILKNAAGERVDAVEYRPFQVSDFTSIERPDPSAKIDSDANGLFDGWYGSESKANATPTLINENPGMYTLDEATGKWVKHSPREITLFNQPLSDLSQVQQLSCGKNWKKFTISDVARMADRFAYEMVNLPLAEHYKGGQFIEKAGVFESSNNGDSGIWEFLKLSQGNYLLSILSDDLSLSGQRIQVALKPEEEKDFGSSTYQLLFNQGNAFYGVVGLPKEPYSFQLKIVNDSSQRLGLKAIQLEPINFKSGRINVNTASLEVLRSLFVSDDLVQIVLQNRPIGIKDDRRLGVGELFLQNPAFLIFHDNLTVKSDVYEINSWGEYVPLERTLAYQTIRSVVERGD